MEQIWVFPLELSEPITCHPRRVRFPTGWKGRPWGFSTSALRWLYCTPNIKLMGPALWGNSTSRKCEKDFSRGLSRAGTFKMVLSISWASMVNSSSLSRGEIQNFNPYLSSVALSHRLQLAGQFARFFPEGLEFWQSPFVSRLCLLPLSTRTFPSRTFPFAALNWFRTTGIFFLFWLTLQITKTVT